MIMEDNMEYQSQIDDEIEYKKYSHKIKFINNKDDFINYILESKYFQYGLFMEHIRDIVRTDLDHVLLLDNYRH